MSTISILKRAAENHKRRVLRCKHSGGDVIEVRFHSFGYDIDSMWCPRCGAMKLLDGKGVMKGVMKWRFPKDRYDLYNKGYMDRQRLMESMEKSRREAL